MEDPAEFVGRKWGKELMEVHKILKEQVGSPPRGVLKKENVLGDAGSMRH